MNTRFLERVTLVFAPLALVGTQGLFWLWWGERYHPAKFTAVLSFQLFLFASASAAATMFFAPSSVSTFVARS